MAHRRIGQERLGFGREQANPASPLDEMSKLIGWTEVARTLGDIYTAAKGEHGWPPLALFKALLLATWYDLSDVKLAEAVADRASFRRFCGFSATEPTPERYQAKPGGKVSPPCERDRVADRSNQGSCVQHPDARDAGEP